MKKAVILSLSTLIFILGCSPTSSSDSSGTSDNKSSAASASDADSSSDTSSEGNSDVKGNDLALPPIHLAKDLKFSDTDAREGFIAGEVKITKALDESDVTGYVLYWGKSTSGKIKDLAPVVILPTTGSDLSYTLTSIALPQGATHFLLYTQNANGVMIAGLNILIDDRSTPEITAGDATFSDGDNLQGKIGGGLLIQKAKDESQVSQYVLYWGNGQGTKLAGHEPIVSLAAKGEDLTYDFPMGTALPEGAKSLMIYIKNESGEQSVGIEEIIIDFISDTNLKLLCVINPPALSEGQCVDALPANLQTLCQGEGLTDEQCSGKYCTDVGTEPECRSACYLGTILTNKLTTCLTLPRTSTAEVPTLQ
ncbi:hypothetical protein WDW89_07945 [Deltaproteobacteria bacterium TL4]